MLSRVLLEDTIAAVVSPRGRGGISVIRVSGPNCLHISRRLCCFIPVNPESHKIYLGIIQRCNGEKVDQVLVSYFAKGKSFTGEETIEISCHGNPVITSEILSELVLAGVRIAERGEFSYRAFMSGKIDLVQAESILTLIDAESRNSTKVALSQLGGVLSEKLNEIEQDLIHLLANLEASIDFSTEDIDPFSRGEIQSKFEKVVIRVEELLRSYKRGRLFNEGLKIALVGKPNVGKSSLLNLFLGKDRAIVSEEAGTTRDVIDGVVSYEGVKFEFFDTAGIRDFSSGKVEEIGINRSISTAAEADVIAFVYDISDGFNNEDLLAWEKIELGPNQAFYILGNKSDLLSEGQKDLPSVDHVQEIQKLYSKNQEIEAKNFFCISAFNSEIKDVFFESLVKNFDLTVNNESAVVSNARHFDLLSEAKSQINRAREEFLLGVGEEFLTIALRNALGNILSILGKHYDDQVLDKIFKEFCLGK